MQDSSPLPKISLLHVDDNEDYLLLMRARLAKLTDELEIVSAADADQALAALNEREFTCILCDFQMPDMDGLQLLQSLRENGNATPFIFLSSRDDQQLADTALRNGASEYITKEIGLEMFQRILKAIRRTQERLNPERQTPPPQPRQALVARV